MPKTYISNVEEDGEELVLVLPTELMEEVGWVAGDDIEWVDNDDGSFSLRKFGG